jgi:hypothetical protein
MASESKKLLSLELVSLSNPQFINKGAIAVIDRPFAGYLLRQRKFQNESVLKVGLNWALANSLREETQNDSISFSVIKKFMAGKPK